MPKQGGDGRRYFLLPYPMAEGVAAPLGDKREKEKLEKAGRVAENICIELTPQVGNEFMVRFDKLEGLLVDGAFQICQASAGTLLPLVVPNFPPCRRVLLFPSHAVLLHWHGVQRHRATQRMESVRLNSAGEISVIPISCYFKRRLDFSGTF